MRWIVAQCESQRQHVARMFLMREFEMYAPRIKQHGRIMPLFPTYLFVRTDGRWYSIRWSVGITRVLMNGDKPAQLDDEIVSSIRRREVAGIVVLPRAPRLRPGQRVRILHGSFQGLYGLYDGMVGHDRERILIDLLGRKTAVVLPAHNVAAG
jgi:transcriptional antiterminator RfaH